MTTTTSHAVSTTATPSKVTEDHTLTFLALFAFVWFLVPAVVLAFITPIAGMTLGALAFICLGTAVANYAGQLPSGR